MVCHLPYLIPYRSDDDAHEGADEIEETIGQIGEGGYAKHGALSHAASVPRHKHGGDSDTIFGGATEEAAIVALAIIDALKHVVAQEDADVLIGHGKVEHET